MELAEQGNAEAQYAIGIAYLDGTKEGQNLVENAEFYPTESDIEAARKWLNKAAENDFAEAYSGLAAIENGYEDNPNNGKITGYWEKAIELGSEVSKFNYGISLINDEIYGAQALKYLEENQAFLAENPGLEALTNQTLFETYSYGNAHVERDLKRAMGCLLYTSPSPRDA